MTESPYRKYRPTIKVKRIPARLKYLAIFISVGLMLQLAANQLFKVNQRLRRRPRNDRLTVTNA